MVFFEAPHRTEAALAAMAAALGDDRPAAVCRELTKTHEEVRRGPLADLVAWAGEGVRGEVTIVVAGAPPVAAVASDPGYRLVVAAVGAGVPVTAVPGPSAVLTALAVSGLPVDRFCFEGFLPRKAGERSRRLAALAAEERTMVFFEAPHRTEAALAAMAAAFGDERAAAVCRELTKTHEEVRRGPLGDLVAWAGEGVRGEVTIVVTGVPAAPDVDSDPDSLLAAVAGLEAGGTPRKAAVVEVARRAGVPKRDVYNLVHGGQR